MTTSTTTFRGILTPTFTRRGPQRDHRVLQVEKKKVEARKAGQVRALSRL